MRPEHLTLLAGFEIRASEVTSDEWLHVWGERADDALVNEPDTLAYAAAISATDPDQVLIFERYRLGRASLQEHMEHPAHGRLMSEMTRRNMTRRRLSLLWLDEVPDWGRWHGDRAASVKLGLSFVVTGLNCSAADDADALIDSTRDAAAGAVKVDPGLMLGIGRVAEPDPRTPELAVGDLVIVECAESPQVGSSIAQRSGATIRITREYGTTSHGFFWR